jgi:hypothetical protein
VQTYWISAIEIKTIEDFFKIMGHVMRGNGLAHIRTQQSRLCDPFLKSFNVPFYKTWVQIKLPDLFENPWMVQ